jgi:hypothetical protein
MRRDSELLCGSAPEGARGEDDDEVAHVHGSPEVGVLGPVKEAK